MLEFFLQTTLHYIPAFLAASVFFFLVPLFNGGGGDIVKKLTLAIVAACYVGECHLPDNNFFHAMPHFMIALLIGLICALPVILITSGADFLGETIDVARGQSTASFIDPQLEVETSVLGTLLKQMTLSWAFSFLALPDAMVALRLLCHELIQEHLATDSFLLMVTSILSIQAQYMSAILRLLFPFIIVWLLVGGLLIFVSRVAPQFSGTTEALVLKTLASFVIVVGLVSMGERSPEIVALIHPTHLQPLIK